MVYDDMQKKWVPSGSSSGLSKVQIYHHQQNNTFRVVGRKLQDHEVVINCSILKGLKYNQATATFHQWRDSKFVYGLNFSSQQDAENFARAMMHALEVLSGRVIQQSVPPPPNGAHQVSGRHYARIIPKSLLSNQFDYYGLSLSVSCSNLATTKTWAIEQ